MKIFKKFTALVLSAVLVLSFASVSASAAKAKAPLSIEVRTSASSVDYLEMITVTVTIKNTSKSKVSNIVASSSDSIGLAMVKPKGKNVVISNPGKAVNAYALKNNAMTTCLLPGGTLKYTYSVVLGYQYARHIIPESTSKLMLKQHKALKTKNFRDINITAPYVKASKILKFGDVGTGLIVKAYYSVPNSVYNSITSGNTVTETYTSSVSVTESSSKSGLTPNFKKWVDAYEKFMKTNYYVINHSDEFSTSDSIAILSKYAEYTAELEKYQSDEDLTLEDIAYLNSALARIAAYAAATA